MVRIAGHIADGAWAFLRAEYRVVALFVVSVALLLLLAGVTTDGLNPFTAVAFLVGALCSGLAGLVGMKVAHQSECALYGGCSGWLGRGARCGFRRWLGDWSHRRWAWFTSGSEGCCFFSAR